MSDSSQPAVLERPGGPTGLSRLTFEVITGDYSRPGNPNAIGFASDRLFEMSTVGRDWRNRAGRINDKKPRRPLPGRHGSNEDYHEQQVITDTTDS
jgi:hypothetical protein